MWDENVWGWVFEKAWNIFIGIKTRNFFEFFKINFLKFLKLPRH
jgi:hypothetical protein